MDTKLALARVRENNPKATVKDRYNPDKQYRDCRLGVKKRKIIRPGMQTKSTPKENSVRISTIFTQTEFHKGYASGVVATKLPGLGEFVLAELTQPFNKKDSTYFFPLMAKVERSLEFQPHFGSLDFAYDAFCIYEYCHSEEHDGFSAVPLADRAGYKERFYDSYDLPLFTDSLATPFKFTSTDCPREIIEHERGKHVYTLLFPSLTESAVLLIINVGTIARNTNCLGTII